MTLILASGRGLKSLLLWQSASGSVPELLQLDAVFEPRPPYGSAGSRSSVVSFQFQRSRSLWLSQALRRMSSDWRLTSWSVSKAGSEFLETYGVGGVVLGRNGTPFTTERDQTNY